MQGKRHISTKALNLFQTTIKKAREIQDISKHQKFIIDYEFNGLKLDHSAWEQLGPKNCLEIAKLLLKVPFFGGFSILAHSTLNGRASN